MDDATRKAIEGMLSDGSGPWHASDVLWDALAREAEKTTLVTPEWMDGSEAKRLGFEGTGDDGHWFLKSSPGYRVAVDRGCSLLSVHEREGLEGLLFRNPTIAHVRDAVFLATGRD